MVNISQITSFVRNLKGTSGTFTMGEDAIRTLVCKGGKKANKIYSLFSGVASPAVDVAYGTSKHGYQVAKLAFRDGEKALGNMFISAKDLDTVAAQLKLRLSLGENGSALQAVTGFDSTKATSLNDFAMSLLRKNGVIKASNTAGRKSGHAVTINEAKLTEFLTGIFGAKGERVAKGMTAGISEAEGNLSKVNNWMTDLLAGKDAVRPGELFGAKPSHPIPKVLTPAPMPDKAAEIAKAAEKVKDTAFIDTVAKKAKTFDAEAFKSKIHSTAPKEANLPKDIKITSFIKKPEA